MTAPPSLPALLSDRTLRDREYPACRSGVFLAHAGVSPLPARVARAMSELVERSMETDQERAAEGAAEGARRSAAALLGAGPGEVALVGPTSQALSLLASGFPLEEGDNVVAYPDAYPSNFYPWRAMARRGAEVRRIRTRELGAIEPEDVLEQVDSRTRLVSLDSCHFLTGHVPDLGAIGRELRERGIAFCVDAIQSLGALELDLEHVDFLAAGAHKWLMGPCSAGVLYVSRSWHGRLQPMAWGWRNLRSENFAALDRVEYRPGAGRFEVATENLCGLAGLGAALELVRGLGIGAVAREVRARRARLCVLLEQAGAEILGGCGEPGRRGGMVSARWPGRESRELAERLEERGIRTSLRPVRAGQEYVRFSPHYYIAEEEIEEAAACCAAWAQGLPTRAAG